MPKHLWPMKLFKLVGAITIEHKDKYYSRPLKLNFLFAENNSALKPFKLACAQN